MKVELEDEEWKQILFMLQETPSLPLPWKVTHNLLMKIGEQLKKQSATVLPMRK